MNDRTANKSDAVASDTQDQLSAGPVSTSDHTGPIAFFCRAKPQRADILSICLKHERIFVGWPLFRDGTPKKDGWRALIVDPTCPRDKWEQALRGRKSTRQFSQNRNFIDRVTPGSIVVIPRPEQGAVYCSRVKDDFEIVDAPPWADEYLKLRKHQGLEWDDLEYLADVVQSWPVDQYKRIELPQIPGWLRHSMFGQSTYGEFKDHPLDKTMTTAYGEFDRLLNGDGPVWTDWTLDVDEIKRRLVDTLTPTAFEHLVVSLLQLEHPDEIWHQTGGPGDGGIDGLGSNEKGEVVGLMQAKLRTSSVPQLGGLGHSDRQIVRYAAILVLEGQDRETDDNTTLLDIEWIAKKFLRHRHDLPQALAMRVGVTSPP